MSQGEEAVHWFLQQTIGRFHNLNNTCFGIIFSENLTGKNELHTCFVELLGSRDGFIFLQKKGKALQVRQ